MITYLQAVVIGLLQGVTELFPVSSLGHSVLVPAWIGGGWELLVTDFSSSTSQASPYLAFIVVAAHVATAIALLVFFRSDWVRIMRALVRSVRPSLTARRILARDADERLAWLLIIGTIPVEITGLQLEHTFRSLFAKPLAAAIFLSINGVILLAGEYLRRRASTDEEAAEAEAELAVVPAGLRRDNDWVPARRPELRTPSYREAGIIGAFQSLALLADISRSGISMVGQIGGRGGTARVDLLSSPVNPHCKGISRP